MGAGLDDVGADAAAAVGLVVVRRLDVGLALGVLADRDAAHRVVAEVDLHAGDALDGLEDGVHRAVADRRLLHPPAVLVAEDDRGRRDRAGAGAGVEALQRPQGRGVVNLRLGQRLNVGVVDVLLAVGQRLEALEDALELGLVEVVAQFADALPQGVPAAVLAQHQLGPL